MKNILTEVGIKYSPILDMPSVAKGMATPFMADGEAQVLNIGRPAEGLLLAFNEGRYSIQFDWVQLLFKMESDSSSLEKPNGPIEILFSLREKIKKHAPSSVVRSYWIDTWDIMQEEVFPTSVVSMREKYFSRDFAPTIDGIDDLAIIVEGKESNGDYSITFGPYNPETDVEKHKLYVFTDKKAEVFGFKETGTLIHFRYTVEKREQIDLKELQRLFKIKRQLIRQLNRQ